MVFQVVVYFLSHFPQMSPSAAQQYTMVLYAPCLVKNMIINLYVHDLSFKPLNTIFDILMRIEPNIIYR